VLDEDLASIARQVQARVNCRGDLESGGGPEIVTIKVNWLRHSLNSDGHADVGTFEMKRVSLIVLSPPRNVSDAFYSTTLSTHYSKLSPTQLVSPQGLWS
jgi:hypothetical protein